MAELSYDRMCVGSIPTGYQTKSNKGLTMAGTRVKTKVCELKYVTITGEGRNQAMPGSPERMQYVASVVMPKDGEAHKFLLEQIEKEWQDYKTRTGVKGRPKTNGIKEETVADSSGEIDPETEEVKRVPTGNVIATFRTNVTWPDGSPRKVKVKDRKGKDITEAVHNANWTIGNGSMGVIHGIAMANDVGGKHKVSLYLTAIQLAKLVKYMGDDVECDEIDGEDIDLGDEVAAIDESDEVKPEL